MSRASRRSALILAVGVLVGVAAAAPAAADELNTPVFVTPAQNNAQPNAAAQPATANQAVAPDRLNNVDRSLHPNATAQPTAPAASNDTPAANSAAVTAAGAQHSVWDETSLIGKIFIGFGALLTIASAARMFIA